MAGRELAWKAVTYTAVFAAGTVAVQQGLIRVDVKEKGEDASLRIAREVLGETEEPGEAREVLSLGDAKFAALGIIGAGCASAIGVMLLRRGRAPRGERQSVAYKLRK